MRKSYWLPIKMAAAETQFKAGVDPGKAQVAWGLVLQLEQERNNRASALTRLWNQWQSGHDAISDETRKIKNGYYKSGNEIARAMGDLKSREESLTRLKTQDIAQAKGAYDRADEEYKSGLAIYEEEFIAKS